MFNNAEHERGGCALPHSLSPKIGAGSVPPCKVTLQGGAGLALLAETVRATTARAAGTPFADLAADVDAALARLVEVTGTLWGTGDPALALANASAYLDAAGHTVVAWLWLEQALATREETSDFHRGKRAAARYFHRHELPKVHTQLELLESLDRTLDDLERGGWCAMACRKTV